MRHKKCHSPIKQNDHLKTVKFIKLAIESYVDSVLFMHMPLCIQTESSFLKKGNGSGLKVAKPSRQEINSRMKQAIIYSGIAEEYVNWIQCLSCDIWVHEKCARGTFSDRCKACHSHLPILRLKNSRANQISTLKGHSTRPYPMSARTGLNCGSLPYLAWITFCI